MDLFMAVVLAIIALVLLLAGFRLARLAIPLWGFAVGFLLGATLLSDVSNVKFLDTTGSVVVGLLAGALTAFLAYLYYAFAVLVLAGGTGYWLGSGFLLLLGFKPGTWSALVGLVAGVLFAATILLSRASKAALIILTSLAGTVSFISAALVAFNVAPIDGLSYIASSAGIRGSWIWPLTVIAFVAIGVSIQMLTSPDYKCEKWAVGIHQNHTVRRTKSSASRHT